MPGFDSVLLNMVLTNVDTDMLLPITLNLDAITSRAQRAVTRNMRTRIPPEAGPNVHSRQQRARHRVPRNAFGKTRVKRKKSGNGERPKKTQRMEWLKAKKNSARETDKRVRSELWNGGLNALR